MIQIGIMDQFAFAADCISIGIRDKGDGYLLYARGFSEEGFINWERIPTEDAMLAAKPTLNLTENVARALMDKLISYFEGSTDTRTIRKDYLHEQERRDRLEDTLMAIATGMTR